MIGAPNCPSHEAHGTAALFKRECLEHLDHGLQMVNADTGLRSVRQGRRSAHLLANRLANFRIALVVRREHSLQQLAPSLPGSLGIRLESPSGGRHGALDVRGATHGYHAGRLLGRGIDDFEFPRQGRGDPFAVDIEVLALVAHR